MKSQLSISRGSHIQIEISGCICLQAFVEWITGLGFQGRLLLRCAELSVIEIRPLVWVNVHLGLMERWNTLKDRHRERCVFLLFSCRRRSPFEKRIHTMIHSTPLFRKNLLINQSGLGDEMAGNGCVWIRLGDVLLLDSARDVRNSDAHDWDVSPPTSLYSSTRSVSSDISISSSASQSPPP